MNPIQLVTPGLMLGSVPGKDSHRREEDSKADGGSKKGNCDDI